MKNYLLLVFLFATISVFGQSFWAEDFSNGLPNDWTTEDLNGHEVLWDFCNDATCDLPSEPFQSQSADNGFLFVDPPINLNQFKSVLTTHMIDCSDKESIFLEFETFVQTERISAANGYALYVKNEDEDWLKYEILPEQNKASGQQLSHNTEKITIDISDRAAQKSAVQIRWEWVGIAEEILALDDVKLFEFEPFYERVVWGNEPGQGDFDGGLNDWNFRVLSPFNDSTFKWEWEPYGSVDKAFSVRSFQRLKDFKDNFPYLNSYSNHNGAMVFNADFFSTNGTTPTNDLRTYVSELISPVIDLSDVQNELNLRFDQLGMFGGMPPNPAVYPSNTFLNYSFDGGATWETPIAFNNDQLYNAIFENTQIISLCEAAGTPEFRMKFTFVGQLFFWAIDDIVLVEKDDFDLEIKRNFFSVAPNFQTPVSQTEPLFFLVDIENFGNQRQEDISLFVNVTDLSDSQIVYRDTVILDSINSCELRQNVIFGRFVPPQKVTNYEVEYSILSNGIDATPENNLLSWNFEITESTYAKESGATIGISPTDADASYEYGNCYFLENGNGFMIDEVTFGLADPAISAGSMLNIVVYRFFGDANADDRIDLSMGEATIIGSNVYTVLGNEHNVSDGLVTVPILDLSTPDLRQGVATEDGAFYLATVQYNNELGRICPIQASQVFDYSATFFMYDSLNLPRFAGLEDIGGRFDLRTLIDLIPVIRMNVTEFVSGVSEIKQEPLLVHPNPTNGLLEISKTQRSQNAILELFDLKGRLLKKWDNNDSILSIEEFENGFYFLKMKTEDSVYTGKVLKVGE